jgi:AcrR family transcriptional regulator
MTEQSGADQSGAGQPGKRAAQGQATRDQLIEVATGLFAEHGYEGTSIEAVLAAAGVSRGALYHHFAGKDVLFEAVVMALQDRVMADLTKLIGDTSGAVSTLRAAALAWIDLAGDPVIQQVMLIDAPSVLGWERWRAMDDQYAFNATRALLAEVAAEGGLAPEFVDAFSHMLLAALDAIALEIARAADQETAMAEGRAAVSELLRRLTTPAA